jgi:hypothetical protein
MAVFALRSRGSRPWPTDITFCPVVVGKVTGITIKRRCASVPTPTGRWRQSILITSGGSMSQTLQPSTNRLPAWLVFSGVVIGTVGAADEARQVCRRTLRGGPADGCLRSGDRIARRLGIGVAHRRRNCAAGRARSDCSPAAVHNDEETLVGGWESNPRPRDYECCAPKRYAAERDMRGRAEPRVVRSTEIFVRVPT